MYIEYGFQKNYITTVDRSVGASTLTRVLSNTNTSEYIYLAPNGNDANDGLTPGNAVLTLDAALSLLDLTHNTVHIIRNGFVGDIVIDLNSDFFMNTGQIIQVELGEIATIQVPGGNGYKVVITYDCQLNGLKNIYYYNEFNQPRGARFLAAGVDNFLEAPKVINCSLIDFDKDDVEGPFFVKLQYSLFWSVDAESGIPTNPTRLMLLDAIEANNCIFFDYPIQLNFSFEDSTPSLFEQCLFVNMDAALYEILPSNQDLIVNMNGCNFLNVNYLYLTLAEERNYDLIINLDYCKLSLGISAIETNNKYTVLNISNSIPPDTNNLFVNQNNGVNTRDAESFRLQIKGKNIPNTDLRYLITSPLRNAYGGTEDVNPWEETVTGPLREFTQACKINWPAKSLEAIPLFVNVVENFDVLGNIDNTYDNFHWKFNFVYSEDTHIQNEDIWCLVKALQDKGTKRLYLKGQYDSLFDDSATGILDDINYTFTPDITDPMVENHWKHFWIIINGEYHYYINGNTSNTLELVDKFGNGFPVSGRVNFTIEYVTVKTVFNTFNIIQRLFTQFQWGGRWRENWSRPKENYQYSIDRLETQSTSELIENV